MTVRTRFAPSPTGYLHIGGARTALFSWLYARKNKGKFILRIEDTDRERSTEESVQAILDGMEWLGLDYDEGPFYQTQHMDRYRAVIQRLLSQGHAYHCYCSKARLEKLREQQMANKLKPRYDGHCRAGAKPAEKAAGDAPVVRFKTPTEGDVIVSDQIHGQVVFNTQELDDLVIARGDGTPTYNFTVVVDDIDMNVTHVIRGDDHLNNTPRQIPMFKALGAVLPKFAHVPMILGADGKRLSKRHGAVSVMQYKEEGYLPEALLNYLVRLGWSHGDQEIFSLDEMVSFFEITDCNKSPTTFNPEKLLWLNQHYIKTLDASLIAEKLKPYLLAESYDLDNGPALDQLVLVQRDRVKTLVEMAKDSAIFFRDFGVYDKEAADKYLQASVLEAFKSLLAELEVLNDWNAEQIHHIIKNTADKHQLKMGMVAQPLRVAVTGNTASPSIDKTIMLLGKTRTVQYLQRAIKYIQP